jgi:hypothetical protein
MIKLNKKQIKDLEWVLENIDMVHWNDEEDPYFHIDGWLGGSLEYRKEDLENDLVRAIKSKEHHSKYGFDAFELVISHYKKNEEEEGGW